MTNLREGSASIPDAAEGAVIGGESFHELPGFQDTSTQPLWDSGCASCRRDLRRFAGLMRSMLAEAEAQARRNDSGGTIITHDSFLRRVTQVLEEAASLCHNDPASTPFPSAPPPPQPYFSQQPPPHTHPKRLFCGPQDAPMPFPTPPMTPPSQMMHGCGHHHMPPQPYPPQPQAGHPHGIAGFDPHNPYSGLASYDSHDWDYSVHGDSWMQPPGHPAQSPPRTPPVAHGIPPTPRNTEMSQMQKSWLGPDTSSASSGGTSPRSFIPSDTNPMEDQKPTRTTITSPTSSQVNLTSECVTAAEPGSQGDDPSMVRRLFASDTEPHIRTAPPCGRIGCYNAEASNQVWDSGYDGRNRTSPSSEYASSVTAVEETVDVAKTVVQSMKEDGSGNTKNEVPSAVNMETKATHSHHSFPREHPFYRECAPSPLIFLPGDNAVKREEQMGTCKNPMLCICGKNGPRTAFTILRKPTGLESSTTIWPSTIPDISATTIEECPTKPSEDLPCESASSSCTGCPRAKSLEPMQFGTRCHFVNLPPLPPKSSCQPIIGTAPRRYILSSLSDGTSPSTECVSTDGTICGYNQGSSNEISSDDYNATNGSFETPTFMVYNVHTKECPHLIAENNIQQQSSSTEQHRSCSPNQSVQLHRSILKQSMQPQQQMVVHTMKQATVHCVVTAPSIRKQCHPQSPSHIKEQSSDCHETTNQEAKMWDSLAAEAQAVALAVSALMPAAIAASSPPPAPTSTQSEQTWNQIRAEALEVAKAVLTASGHIATNAALGESQTNQEQKDEFAWEQIRRDAEAVALAALSLGEHIPPRSPAAPPLRNTAMPVSYIPQYNVPVTAVNFEPQQIGPPVGWTPTTPADTNQQNNYVYWETVPTAPAPQTPRLEIDTRPLPCPPTTPCSMTLRANSPNLVPVFSPAVAPIYSPVVPSMPSPVVPSILTPPAPSVLRPLSPPISNIIPAPMPSILVPLTPSPVTPTTPSANVLSIPDPSFTFTLSPAAPSIPDPLVPSIPDPLVPSIPDPLVPSIPDPLVPPLPDEHDPSVASQADPSTTSPVAPPTDDSVQPPTVRVVSPTPSATIDRFPQPPSDFHKLSSSQVSSCVENSVWSLGDQSSRALETCERERKCCHCPTTTGDEGMGPSIGSKEPAATDPLEETLKSVGSSWMESASEGQPELDQISERDSSHHVLLMPPTLVEEEHEAGADHEKTNGACHCSVIVGQQRSKDTSIASVSKLDPEPVERKPCPAVMGIVQKVDAEIQADLDAWERSKRLRCSQDKEVQSSITCVRTLNRDRQQEGPSEKHATSLVLDPFSTKMNLSTSTPKVKSCRLDRRVRVTCSRPEFSTDATTSSIQQEHYFRSLHAGSESNQNVSRAGISPRDWFSRDTKGDNIVKRDYDVGFVLTSKPMKTVRFQETIDQYTQDLSRAASLHFEQRATQTEFQELRVAGKGVQRSTSAMAQSSESESSDSGPSATSTSPSSTPLSPNSPTRSPPRAISSSSSSLSEETQPSASSPDTPFSSNREQSETVDTRPSMSTAALDGCLTPPEASTFLSTSAPRVLFDPRPMTSFGVHMAKVMFSPTISRITTKAPAASNVCSRSCDNTSSPTSGNVPQSCSTSPLNDTTDTPITSKTFDTQSNEKQKEVPCGEGPAKKRNFCNICSSIMLNLKAHLALISSAAEFAQLLVEDIGGGHSPRTASEKLIRMRNDSSEQRRRVARVGSLKAKRRLGQRHPQRMSNPLSPAHSSNSHVSDRFTADSVLLERDVISAMHTVARNLSNTQEEPPAEHKSPDDIAATEEDNPALSTRGIASASSSGSALCERRWVELRRLERAARRRRLREERDAAAASLARTLRASVQSAHSQNAPAPVPEAEVKEPSLGDEVARKRSSTEADKESPASQSSGDEGPTPAMDADSPGATGGPSQPASSQSSSCSHSSASATSLDTTTRVSHLESMESFRQRVAAVRVGDFTLPWATGSNLSAGHPPVFVPRIRMSPSTESLFNEPAIIQSLSDDETEREQDTILTTVFGGTDTASVSGRNFRPPSMWQHCLADLRRYINHSHDELRSQHAKNCIFHVQSVYASIARRFLKCVQRPQVSHLSQDRRRKTTCNSHALSQRALPQPNTEGQILAAQQGQVHA